MDDESDIEQALKDRSNELTPEFEVILGEMLENLRRSDRETLVRQLEGLQRIITERIKDTPKGSS